MVATLAAAARFSIAMNSSYGDAVRFVVVCVVVCVCV